MKVVFLDHSGLPGGGQLGLARYLAHPHRADASVAVLGAGPAFDPALACGVQVDVLGGASSRSWASPRSFLRLARTLKQKKPQLVVANSVKAAIVAAWIPIPRGTMRVYYMRDDLNPRRNSWLKLAILSMFVLPRFDAFIANSAWTASTLPRRFHVRPVRIAYPVSGARELNHLKMADPVHILSLSRLAPWKGIHVLVDALCELERRGYVGRFRATIAGSSAHAGPSYARDLHRAAGKVQSAIEFAGHLPDPLPLIATADCLVAVSMTPEPFGQVIVQGMLGGLIVIAGNEGGAREQITDSHDGYLVNPGDAKELADCLQTVIDAFVDHDEMRRFAVESALRFADVAVVSQMDAALEQIGNELLAEQSLGDLSKPAKR